MGIAITHVIPGWKPLDQLHEPVVDGHPDINATFNCVPTSIADAASVLTGKQFYGDELKDLVYGPNYKGVQAAAHFVQWAHDQGLALARVTTATNWGGQDDLLRQIHAAVDAGIPCIITMPSAWATAQARPWAPWGSTHVGVMMGTGPGALRCMNPWHGFYQDAADGWWRARLCEHEFWTLKRLAGSPATTHPVASPTGAPQPAAGGPTHVSINVDGLGGGMKSYAEAHAASQISGGEHYYTQHDSFAALSNGTVLHWDGANLSDTHAAEVAAALWQQREQYRQQAEDLATKLDAAQRAATDAQQKLTAAENTLTATQDELTAAKAQVGDLEVKLAKVAAPAPATPTAPAPATAAAPALSPDDQATLAAAKAWAFAGIPVDAPTLAKVQAYRAAALAAAQLVKSISGLTN